MHIDIVANSQEISFSNTSEATSRNDVNNNMVASALQSFPPKKRRLTSSVWNDFEKVKEGGKDFAACKHCTRRLVGDSKKGTSHLHKHLKKCLLYNRAHSDMSQLLIKASEPKKDGTSQLMIKASEPSKEGPAGIQCVRFDQERSRNDLAHMIILHGYPFSIVNHYGFRTFLNNLQPSFKIVSHNTIKADCMKIYEEEKRKLYKVLDKLPCRISLTANIWASSQNLGYLSLTAHYIDDDWKLQKNVLNFCLVETPHTGEVISKVIMEKLYNWNICGKLCSITLENCALNDVVVRTLHSELIPKGLLLKNGELFHVRCCTHILDLIVWEGLKAVDEVTQKIREFVKYVKSSHSRRQMFNDITKQVEAPQKKLVLDVPTKWTSTFIMLATALELKDAITLLAECDPNFKAAPSLEEWEKAKVTCECLKLFYDVTRILYGTKYPTANRCFAEICGIHLQLKEWCKCGNYYVEFMAIKMNEIFDKYWSTTNLLLAIAAILDPRVKMKSIEYYFPLIHENEAEFRMKAIRDGLHSLYNVYAACLTASMPDQDFSLNVDSGQGDVNGGSSGFSGAASHVTFSDRRKGFDKFLQESSSNQQVKSDLEMYLDDAVHPLKNDLDLDSFDVLGWWKFNAPKYPIVAQMARDILGVPVSTASEGIDNLNGRILDQYWSSMRPEVVQGLMCTQDWLRKEIEASALSLGDSALSTLSSLTDDDDTDSTELASLMIMEEENKT